MQASSRLETNLAASDVFYLEYIEADSGQKAHRRVVGHRIAKALARSIAIASGRRVIVRRQPPDRSGWSVLIWDSNTSQMVPIANGLSGATARAAQRHFDHEYNRAVMILWPDWAPTIKAVEV